MNATLVSMGKLSSSRPEKKEKVFFLTQKVNDPFRGRGVFFFLLSNWRRKAFFPLEDAIFHRGRRKRCKWRDSRP